MWDVGQSENMFQQNETILVVFVFVFVFVELKMRNVGHSENMSDATYY